MTSTDQFQLFQQISYEQLFTQLSLSPLSTTAQSYTSSFQSQKDFNLDEICFQCTRCKSFLNEGELDQHKQTKCFERKNLSFYDIQFEPIGNRFICLKCEEIMLKKMTISHAKMHQLGQIGEKLHLDLDKTDQQQVGFVQSFQFSFLQQTVAQINQNCQTFDKQEGQGKKTKKRAKSQQPKMASEELDTMENNQEPLNKVLKGNSQQRLAEQNQKMQESIDHELSDSQSNQIQENTKLKQKNQDKNYEEAKISNFQQKQKIKTNKNQIQQQAELSEDYNIDKEEQKNILVLNYDQERNIRQEKNQKDQSYTQEIQIEQEYIDLNQFKIEDNSKFFEHLQQIAEQIQENQVKEDDQNQDQKKLSLVLAEKETLDTLYITPNPSNKTRRLKKQKVKKYAQSNDFNGFKNTEEQETLGIQIKRDQSVNKIKIKSFLNKKKKKQFRNSNQILIHTNISNQQSEDKQQSFKENKLRENEINIIKSKLKRMNKESKLYLQDSLKNNGSDQSYPQLNRASILNQEQSKDKNLNLIQICKSIISENYNKDNSENTQKMQENQDNYQLYYQPEQQNFLSEIKNLSNTDFLCRKFLEKCIRKYEIKKTIFQSFLDEYQNQFEDEFKQVVRNYERQKRQRNLQKSIIASLQIKSCNQLFEFLKKLKIMKCRFPFKKLKGDSN